MRPLLLVAATFALSAGCTNPCTELGDRICQCLPVGSTTDACKKDVDNAVKSQHPTSSQDSACNAYLDTCNAPSGVDFCEWIQTRDGQVACGLAF